MNSEYILHTCIHAQIKLIQMKLEKEGVGQFDSLKK